MKLGRWLVAGGTVLLAGQLACSPDLASRSGLLTGPEAFEWDGQSYQIKGEPSMRGNVNTTSDTLELYAVGFPPGTKLSLFGETAVVNEKGVAVLKASFLSSAGDWPVAAFVSPKPGEKAPRPPVLRGSLTVEPVGARPFRVELEQPTSGLGYALRKVEKGPLRFDGDVPGERKPKNVVFAESTFGGLFGEATEGRDIDAIALSRRLAGWTKDCTGYRYANGKAAPNVKVSIQPTEITVYDRRSGKVLAKQTFDANPSCPETALGSRGTSYFPREQVNAWLGHWVAEQSASATGE